MMVSKYQRKTCIHMSEMTVCIASSFLALVSLGAMFLIWQTQSIILEKSSSDMQGNNYSQIWMSYFVDHFVLIRLILGIISVVSFILSIAIWVYTVVANFCMKSSSQQLDSSIISSKQQNNPQHSQCKISDFGKNYTKKQQKDNSSTQSSKDSNQKQNNQNYQQSQKTTDKKYNKRQSKTKCSAFGIFSVMLYFTLQIVKTVSFIIYCIVLCQIENSQQNPNQEVEKLFQQFLIASISSGLSLLLVMYVIVLIINGKSIFRSHKLKNNLTAHKQIVPRANSKKSEENSSKYKNGDSKQQSKSPRFIQVEGSLQFDYPQQNMASMQIFVNKINEQSFNQKNIDQMSQIQKVLSEHQQSENQQQQQHQVIQYYNQEQIIQNKEQYLNNQAQNQPRLQQQSQRVSQITQFTLLDPYIDKYYSRVNNTIEKSQLKTIIYEMIKNQIKVHLTKFNLLTISDQFKSQEIIEPYKPQTIDSFEKRQQKIKQKAINQVQTPDEMNQAQFIEQKTIIEDLIQVMNSMCRQPQLCNIQRKTQPKIGNPLMHKQPQQQKKKKNKLFDDKIMLNLHQRINKKISKRIFD